MLKLGSSRANCTPCRNRESVSSTRAYSGPFRTGLLLRAFVCSGYLVKNPKVSQTLPICALSSAVTQPPCSQMPDTGSEFSLPLTSTVDLWLETTALVACCSRLILTAHFWCPVASLPNKQMLMFICPFWCLPCLS